MVLLAPTRPRRPGSRPAGQRVAQLCSEIKVATTDGQKSAIAELAILASSSESARAAMITTEVEGLLSSFLTGTEDAQLQCWCMSVLANLASDRGAARHLHERQSAAVPKLCTLVASPEPTVRHSAALHLATLSRCEPLQHMITKGGGLDRLRVLEQPFNSKIDAALGQRAKPSAPPTDRDKSAAALKAVGLEAETAEYARWTLRTSQGRNLKRNFHPANVKAARELEAARRVQTMQRGHTAYLKYQVEKTQRSSAALSVQARRPRAPTNAARHLTPSRASAQAVFRAHLSREGLQKAKAVETPAATSLQSAIRGARERKRRLAEAAEREAAEREAAKAAEQEAARPATAPRCVDLTLSLATTDGSEILKVTLKCHCDANPKAAGEGAAAADGNAAAAADAGEPATDAGEGAVAADGNAAAAADADAPATDAGAAAADSNVSARVAISLLDAPADDGDMAREIGRDR